LQFVFRAFRRREEDTDSGDFGRYVLDGGQPLYLHALFEALSQSMVDSGSTATWHRWSEKYRHPAGAAVSDFAAANAEAILFHSWLQWLAGRQLAEAQARARAAGMRIGL